MSLNLYEYSDVFERLACRIIEEELSKNIIASGTTKKTRDEGIDAVIYTKNDFLTIEAKLRKTTVSLGLKDIASSIVFFC